MYRCINDVNEIPVSDNTLVVMFGFPGVGKSFAAEKIAEQFDAYIASSDAIREELFGTAACQDEPNKVFGILQHRATEELKAGGSVIIDATALIRKYRVSNLKTYEGKFKKAIVVVCCTDLDIAFNQNKNRDRHVPEEVIMHMFKTMSFPRMDEQFVAQPYYCHRHEEGKFLHHQVQHDKTNRRHNRMAWRLFGQFPSGNNASAWIYCSAVMSSSVVTSCCSPVSIFFNVTFPAAISVSPTMATKGICLALAYDICFFIFAASG